MKNYYDELEVSKTASKEVIQKVYEFLYNKYNPSIIENSNIAIYEKKLISIKEAFETLSDYEKREKYDLELEQSNPTISYEEYIKVVNERDKLNSILNQLRNSSSNNTKKKKRKKYYYYTSSGKTASFLDYLKYKVKKSLSSIFILLMSLILICLMLYTFFNINIFVFLFK